MPESKTSLLLPSDRPPACSRCIVSKRAGIFAGPVGALTIGGPDAKLDVSFEWGNFMSVANVSGWFGLRGGVGILADKLGTGFSASLVSCAAGGGFCAGHGHSGAGLTE